MATDYSKVQGYQDALSNVYQTGVAKYWGQGYANGNNASIVQGLQGALNNLGDQFTNQFTNLVGRAPTQDEISKFYTEHAANTLQGINQFDIAGNQPAVRSDIQGYIGDTFNKTAQDYATQRLQQQQGQANDLGNLFEQQGNTAINATQQSLLDYQSKLFERLRPNLITSLQSQGLLNTGGFNEAVAGVQGDLANSASNYIAQLQLNNRQAANQIRFGGASAPYQYQQGLITNQPSYLQGAGANAANFNNNTFMSNLDYGHQLGLINAQSQTQPSFLRQFSLGLAPGIGQGLGQLIGGRGGGGALPTVPG